MVKVSVIGAGINGVACAIKIKEKYPEFDVEVISEQFSPYTTGDGSGGLWYPYCCGNTPQSLLNKWGGETYQFLHSCWAAGGVNVSLMPVYSVSRELSEERPEWAQAVLGYQELGGTQLEAMRRLHSEDYASGHRFLTFVAHTETLLTHLYARFVRAGGSLVRRAVPSLELKELNCDVIVNCAGLGARALVPDPQVYPVRGQVMRVKAPWVNYALMDKSSGHYIIPNSETCVLGGTQQANDFNTNIDPKDTEFILKGCISRIPALKGAEIVQEWAGLRPARGEVRLEAEERDGRLIIHNYGHGGSGITLFWGCASDVLELLQAKINHINSTTKSKL